MLESTPRVIAVLNDLMFTVKIQEAAKRAGLTSSFARTRQEVVQQAKQNPVAIILDLNYASVNPLELISTLKTDGLTKDIPLVGYVSHVQVDLRKAAEGAGCDVVVARSAFVQNLPDLLSRFLPNELRS